MARKFDCPSCGASVKMKKNRDQLVCTYCGSMVLVPPEYARRSTPGKQKPVSGGPLAMLVGIALLLVAGAGVLVFFLTAREHAVKEGVEALLTGSASGPVPVLEFGGEGISPGRFEDPRTVAVDADGNIYVGEYSGGRIQVFDSRGEFLDQWVIEKEDIYLSGMGCSRDGILFLPYSGEIWIHDGMTGVVVGMLRHPEGHGFEDAAVAYDCSVIAAWSHFTDDIVRFDTSGEIDLVIPEAISSRTGDSELHMRVAVDGEGNIYVLGTFNSAVFRFDSDGTFRNRFGSEGDLPGSLSAPHAIAVDATGRVLVSDFDGVKIFDSNGTWAGTIPVDGFVFGLAVDDDNMLYTVTSTSMVYVYDLDGILD